MKRKEKAVDDSMRELASESRKRADEHGRMRESDWQQIQGLIRERAAKKASQRESTGFGERLHAFFWAFRRAAVWAPVTAVLVISLWIIFSGNREAQITLACAADTRSPSLTNQPLSGALTLELNLSGQSKSLVLAEGSSRYVGNLLATAGNSPDQQVFDLTIAGMTPTGKALDLSGKLYLNLTSPVVNAPTAAQISSARLEGKLKVGAEPIRDINKIFDKP